MKILIKVFKRLIAFSIVFHYNLNKLLELQNLDLFYNFLRLCLKLIERPINILDGSYKLKVGI